MTPVDLTATTITKGRPMNIIPLNTPHANAVAAWKAACAGEGMTLAEAASTLDAIGYDHAWPVEELIAAVPDGMIDNVLTALQISTGAQLAEAAALRAFRTSRERG